MHGIYIFLQYFKSAYSLTPLCVKVDSTMNTASNKSDCSLKAISRVSTSNPNRIIRTTFLGELSLLPVSPVSPLHVGYLGRIGGKHVVLISALGGSAITLASSKTRSPSSSSSSVLALSTSLGVLSYCVRRKVTPMASKQI